MAMPLEHEFPLFPLALVALPSEQVRLHIFEDRYRTMINACLEQGREFGIVWLAEDELKLVGCACEIARVLERMEDGRRHLGVVPGPERVADVVEERAPGERGRCARQELFEKQ